MQELLPAPAQPYATVLVWFHTLQPSLPSWRGRWMCCLFRSRHALPGLVGSCLKHEATSRVHNTPHTHTFSLPLAQTHRQTLTSWLAHKIGKSTCIHTHTHMHSHTHTSKVKYTHMQEVCQRSLYLGWDSRQCESTHTGTLRWAGRSVLSPSL